MRPIREEAERMINLVERGPLGSGGGKGDRSFRLGYGMKDFNRTVVSKCESNLGICIR